MLQCLTKKGIVLLTLLVFLITGCAGMMGGKKSRQSSSVVDFLYPNKKEVIVKPTVPKLTLPLNVGIAFVPSTSGHYAKHDLDSNQKIMLMERIAEDFKKYKFINNIELIPSEYLRTAGSFDNLEQIKTMYGIDLMVLLSYDQVQYTDEGLVSIMYWTIVGAYIFEGEKNDTSTMIDAAVYDISSRKMLMRAPGVSQVKGTATFVNQSEELRVDSHKGFETASNDLVVNLQNELERFKKKIKEQPEEVDVVYSEGYTGGGSYGGGFSYLFFLLAGIAAWYGRRPETK